MSESVFTPEVLAGKSDAEMTLILAERCMGWPVVDFYADDRMGDTFPRLVHQHPPEANQYYLITGNRDTECLWSPFTRIEHAFMLVPAMREKGFTFFRLECAFDDIVWLAGFAKPRCATAYWKTDAEAARAISLAIIAALEGQNK